MVVSSKPGKGRGGRDFKQGSLRKQHLNKDPEEKKAKAMQISGGLIEKRGQKAQRSQVGVC